MKRTCPAILLCLMSVLCVKAQTVLKGSVVDAETGAPVEMATVQLLYGSKERLVSYAFTDAKGAFALKTAYADSLHLTVSLLGYKSVKAVVTPENTVRIRLAQEAFQIKEVEIRPGRVWGQRDTVNYEVAKFLSANDESIKDVIRKLPGIDVDDAGTISFNGKNISNFYVEGMDLTDGKYNQITNNLNAKTVESVQLLQNHQPIRLLQDKVKTENIAMNLKLKPEFRDKWMLTLQGGAGASPFLWEGWGNAFQLSRKSQSAYIYKGNNRGVDVVDENVTLFNYYAGMQPEPATPQFLSQPSIVAPLKKERLLFNDVHSLSANRLYRLNETTQLRVNSGYIHDKRTQERGSETSYFQQEDTVLIAEQSSKRIYSDQAEIAVNLETNAANRFLTNRFKLTGDWNSSRSDFVNNSAIHQQIKTHSAGVRNDFQTLWDQSDYTFEVRSALRFDHQPASLTVDGVKNHLNLNRSYMDNSLSVLKKSGYLTQQYNVGVIGQLNTIENGYSLYTSPSWQWNKDKWQTRFAAPFVWTSFPGGDFSRFSANPSLYLLYKLNYAWRFSLSGSYRESFGDITNFYTAVYQTDYRHRAQNDGSLPIHQTQSFTLYGEYKNTIREFFATLSLSHIRGRSSHIYEQVIENAFITLLSNRLSNRSTNWMLRGTLSKGFYDAGMKASLDYQLSTREAQQLSKGVRIPYRSNNLLLEPKVSWSASKGLEVRYEATLRLNEQKIGGNTYLDPLWTVVQKTALTYNAYPFDLTVSGDHYYNELNSANSVSAFFADLSLRWKLLDWQFTASVNNLFDRRQYRYTEYSSIQSYTSWVDIRGREFFVSARYRF